MVLNAIKFFGVVLVEITPNELLEYEFNPYLVCDNKTYVPCTEYFEKFYGIHIDYQRIEPKDSNLIIYTKDTLTLDTLNLFGNITLSPADIGDNDNLFSSPTIKITIPLKQ